jgi:3-hydroxyacyl-[acyl-carrier-protein] dehydratase
MGPSFCGEPFGDCLLSNDPQSNVATETAVKQESAEAAAPLNTGLSITEIQQILPHRFPFLLIDRVVEITRKERIVAIKNVTINEPFFQGHFPGHPLMPGVLIVEAMAQAGALLLLSEMSTEHRKNSLAVFTGIEKAKFRRPVTPGDQLRIVVEVTAWRHNAGRMLGKAYLGDKVATEAILTCRIVPRAAGSATGSAAGSNETKEAE